MMYRLKALLSKRKEKGHNSNPTTYKHINYKRLFFVYGQILVHHKARQRMMKRKFETQINK